jgi:FkbM family methyltransferase
MNMMAWRPLARSLQTRAPWLGELKYFLQFSYRELLRSPFEEEFRILARIPPEDGLCYVDVGANRGQTIQSIRMYDRTSPIYAFEPSARIYEICQRYTKKFPGVRIKNVGLGSEPGAFTLYTPVYNGFVFDGLASVDREEAHGWLNARRLAGFSAEKLRLVEQTVRIETLDDQRLAPLFVKIDVQGHEAAVLRGGLATLRRHRPVVLVENGVSAESRDLLAAEGYEAFHYVDGALRPGVGGGRNTLYVHPERRARLGAIFPSGAGGG